MLCSNKLQMPSKEVKDIQQTIGDLELSVQELTALPVAF